MKKLLPVLVLTWFYCCSVFGQNGWNLQQSSITNNLRDIFFVNSQTGWAVGDSGKILKTSNGGINWYQQVSNTTYHLNTVRFFNDQTGWITGGIYIIATPYSYENGIVLKTNNGGANWTVAIQAFSGNIFNDISNLDQNNLYVVSGGLQWSTNYASGSIQKTTDSGNNWTSVSTFPYSSYAFHSINFLNSFTGWTSGIFTTDVPPGTRVSIFKTTNQGVNWNITNIDSGFYMNSQENQKLRFSDANTGYFLQRTLMKSTNSGANWLKIDSSTTAGGKSFHFSDKDTGWFVNSTGFIKKTTNGGLNWISQYTPVSGLLGIYFINSQTGWAVGNNGIILKTTNGGATDTIALRYFPLVVGNMYVYTYSMNALPPIPSYTVKARITKDTIINNKKYFYCQNFPWITSGWVRYDSLTGNLLYRAAGQGCSVYADDKIIDSLNSKINNQISNCTFTYSTLRRCLDTANNVIFGQSVKTKNFLHDGLLYGQTRYAFNFGIISHCTGEPPPCSNFYNLKGCKLNGIVYGDTTMTFGVSGFVRYSDNNQPVTSGKVKAFKLDRQTMNILYLDSANIQSDGSYTLANVPQDSMDIGVFPNSTPPNDWVVTYYPSTIYWEHATVIYPTGNLTNINISALRMSAVSNNNSVNGRISGVSYNPVSNLKDAILYAKNGNTFVRFSMSDAGGIYHLQSLPEGNIKIISTRLGYKRDSTSVNVTTTSNTDSINFILSRYTVRVNQISSEVPSEFKLFQNYPNPFNPVTNIKYQIALNGGSSTNNKLVTLRIYDILGKEVATLVNEKQSPGVYEVMFDAGGLSSGIYFYRLQTENYSEIKRMVLIK